MIPTVKPVTRNEFPLRRLSRSERPARALFTTLAAHTNENDLAALQSRYSLLSVEDLSVLTLAQENHAGTPDRIYPVLPADDRQISFSFDGQRLAATVTAAETAQPPGSLISENA